MWGKIAKCSTVNAFVLYCLGGSIEDEMIWNPNEPKFEKSLLFSMTNVDFKYKKKKKNSYLQQLMSQALKPCG